MSYLVLQALLIAINLMVSVWDARRNPYGARSLLAIRDQREHTRRRKPWTRAFSTTAVKDYEPIVQKRALQLMRELEKKAKMDVPVNLSDWMKSFTYVHRYPDLNLLVISRSINRFDFMGDLVFGGGFETMRDGLHSEPMLHIIEGGLK